MKTCKSCGNQVNDEIKFCTSCGSNLFENEFDSEETGVLNEGDKSFYSPNTQNQQFGNFQPQQPGNSFQQSTSFVNNQNSVYQPPVAAPKKKNKPLIIFIVVAVVLALACIGFVAEKVFQEQGYGSSGNNSNYQQPNNNGGFDIPDLPDITIENSSIGGNSDDVDYTKGTFDGTTYTNEWADIQLDLPDGFYNADEDTYATAQDPNTDCGLYFQSDDTMSIIYICYEKLPAFPVYDEEDYLDALIGNLKKQTSLDYEASDSYSAAEVGGYTYKTAEGRFNNGYGDFVQSMFVRKIDDRVVLISALGVTAEANETLVDLITQVK